jgi:magnesium chelatase subunit H
VQGVIDARMRGMFGGISVTLPADDSGSSDPAAAAAAAAAGAGAGASQARQQMQHTFPDLDDAAFAALGRDQPRLLMALLDAAQRSDPAAWAAFQADVQTQKLRRQRLSGQLSEARGLLDAAQRAAAKQQGLGPVAGRAELMAAGAAGGAAAVSVSAGSPLVGGSARAQLRPVRIVLVCGFESFNVGECVRGTQGVRRAGRVCVVCAPCMRDPPSPPRGRRA